MTYTEAMTALAALGPVSFVAGIVAGYRLRDVLGRIHHDHR